MIEEEEEESTMKHPSYQTLDNNSRTMERDMSQVELEFPDYPNKKKRCGMDDETFILVWCTALLVVIFVVVLIVAAATREKTFDDLDKKLFSFDDMFESTLQSKRVSIDWWNDTTLLKKDSGNLVFADLNNQPISLLVNGSKVIDQGTILSFSSYFVSPNAEFVLLAVQTTKLWRHSFLARYLLYDTVLQTVSDFTFSTDQLANVVWSPKKDANVVAFVRSNNVYTKEIIRGVTTNEQQVTTDGSTNEIVNGVFSWAYEEEIFSSYNAIWWSSSGTKFAYMKSNESLVPEFSFPLYNGGAYTDDVRIKYPKAGYPNPIVSLWVYDITTTNSIQLDTFSDQFEYIYTVQWNNDLLYTQVVNRLQNMVQVLLHEIDNTTSYMNPIFSQSSSTWISVASLYFSNNNILAIQDNEGYNHIVQYNLDGSSPQFLTSGNWVVTSISKITNDYIYYISTEVSSIERHLYRISLSGTDKTRLTSDQGWYSAQFSPNGVYYVLEYSGPNVPNQKMLSTVDSEFVIVLESNDVLKQKLANFNLPTKKFFEIPTADGNDNMNVFTMLPPNFDENEKYPVLMHVYGGPNSQYVHTRFDQTGFSTYVASQLRYIVVSVDGRGTGAKSNAFTKSVYKNLGYYEVLDQLAGAEYLQSLSYVDPHKIAIWGWSYGGYMTGRVLGMDEKKLIKCGVSVAPVASWIYYDSIYTERYMQTPQQNPEGYEQSSVITLAGNITEDSLLLIHGTGDDNVHWQNSAELAKTLISLNKQFQTMYYPNYDHAISARRHLYKFISNFLTEKLSS